ncbi:hypothetical protein CRUP_031982 [Coryphaenoides rupestris]|nr:hypothetical protein CRUP_031982 [Coryphaenoides rupestris]
MPLGWRLTLVCLLLCGYVDVAFTASAGGWSPLDADHYQWLQVDLGSRKQVVAVSTQGRYSSSDWTSNSESESVARHELQRLIVARYVRFVPLQWSKEGRIGLRVEVFGCSYCESTFLQA